MKNDCIRNSNHFQDQCVNPLVDQLNLFHKSVKLEENFECLIEVCLWEFFVVWFFFEGSETKLALSTTSKVLLSTILTHLITSDSHSDFIS